MILDREGNALVRVGFKERKLKWWMRILREHNFFFETVGYALLRSGKPEQAFFAVSLDEGNLVVYKPPKGFTIQQWVEEQVRREREALTDEMKKIDCEADPVRS